MHITSTNSSTPRHEAQLPRHTLHVEKRGHKSTTNPQTLSTLGLISYQLPYIPHFILIFNFLKGAG